MGKGFVVSTLTLGNQAASASIIEVTGLCQGVPFSRLVSLPKERKDGVPQISNHV